jgi:hypothetical protein
MGRKLFFSDFIQASLKDSTMCKKKWGSRMTFGREASRDGPLHFEVGVNRITKLKSLFSISNFSNPSYNLTSHQ